jgi:hypothetical protein
MCSSNTLSISCRGHEAPAGPSLLLHSGFQASVPQCLRHTCPHCTNTTAVSEYEVLHSQAVDAISRGSQRVRVVDHQGARRAVVMRPNFLSLPPWLLPESSTREAGTSGNDFEPHEEEEAALLAALEEAEAEEQLSEGQPGRASSSAPTASQPQAQQLRRWANTFGPVSQQVLIPDPYATFHPARGGLTLCVPGMKGVLRLVLAAEMDAARDSKEVARAWAELDDAELTVPRHGTWKEV